VNPKKEKLVKEAFRDWDKGEKGGLTRHEANCALLSLFGCKPIESELEKLFDSSELELLPLECFQVYCRHRLLLLDRDEDIRHAFKAFDARGDGYISRQTCLDTFRQHASFVPRDVVELVFEEADIDGDGKVSYRDFVKVWKSADSAGEMEVTKNYALSLNRQRLRLV